MSEEITKEQLQNMNRREFEELMGQHCQLKPASITEKSSGFNPTVQEARDRLREMAMTGELDERRKVNPVQKPYQNKYGLGYSMDPDDVKQESLLLSRRK